MEIEAALAFTDSLVFAVTERHLTTLQTEIFRGAWSGQKYEDIAEANFCSETHIKMTGANLWETLSQALEEKVTKKNFRAVLKRRSPESPAKGQAIESKPNDDDLSLDTTATPAQNLTHNSLAIDLELPEGQVKLDSPFYIERPPIETRCYETVLKPGSLIRIKAPKEMGKSSLTIRILAHAEQHDYQTVMINLQLADYKIFEDLDLFLKWFCISTSKQLKLANKVAEYWDDIFGSKMSCKDYFENYLLSEIDQPLVLAIEEVDVIFKHFNLADDFFALLRSWHEEAKSNPVWQKLRLILVHSTEVYIPLNINQSPFNVGLPIELSEFSVAQVQDLAQRHGLSWKQEQVTQLMKMISGHPYLIREAFYNLIKKQQTLKQLFDLADTETSPFSNHLHRHLWNLKQEPNLASALKLVLDSESPVSLDLVEMFKLHSLGLVNLHKNEVTPRCQLYRNYFRHRLSSDCHPNSAL